MLRTRIMFLFNDYESIFSGRNLLWLLRMLEARIFLVAGVLPYPSVRAEQD